MFENGPLSAETTLNYGYQLFEALDYLHHTLKVIHCDIKREREGEGGREGERGREGEGEGKGRGEGGRRGMSNKRRKLEALPQPSMY